MTLTAPYYTPPITGEYYEAALTHYTIPADDFGNLAQLTEYNAQEHAEQDEENAQLAGLLQAVNSATDTQANSEVYSSTPPYIAVPGGLSKRKRVDESPPPHVDDGTKRPKLDANQGTPHPSISAARAAGVHSAAALFRSPASSAAKKYTRPPMSKLYASLHLTPEEFLHLQAAAKTYMLDPQHPERQDCVGSRSKGDNDMVKLKLFNCVRDFLADGVGERFFPEHAGNSEAATDGPGFGDDDTSEQQRWVWPKDGNQIVSLVTPLMRRMVTNERQRMYAHESRKAGPPRGSQAEDEAPGLGVERDSAESTLHDDPDHSPSQQGTVDGAKSQSQSVVAAGRHSHRSHPPPPPPSCATNVIQFIFTHRDIKLLRFDWPSPDGSPDHSHMTFEKLMRTICEHTMGIRAAMHSAGLADAVRPLAYRPTPQAQLARLKAAEAISKVQARRSAAQELDESSDAQKTKQAEQPADLAEELRRQLQSQIDGTADEDHSDRAQDGDATSTLPTLDTLAAKVRAFGPEGLSPIDDALAWSRVRDKVAGCLWLEGCLRVAVDLL